MSVSHGADPARLREAGQQLSRSGDQLDAVATSGGAMTKVLAEAWQGADLDYFAGQAWPAAQQQMSAGSQMLQAMSEAALRNAQDQEDASGGGSGGPGGGGPGGRGGDAPGASDQRDPGQSRDPEEYGDLPAEVREKWGSYDDDQKREIIEQIIKERAEHYGIDQPKIIFDDDMSGNGSWRERSLFADEVRINPDKLDDPMILHTVYHEMRHAAQHEAVRDANPTWFWQDPEYNHGMTPEQVQEWEDNFDDYESPPPSEQWTTDRAAAEEQYQRYFEQPVEVDARDEGARYLEDLTPEELDRLLNA